MSDIQTIRIERLGAQGDGIAEGPIYVPFALPGETVRVRRSGDRATLVDVVTPSPERSASHCPHYGTCGGCAVQHLADDGYRRWKTDLLVQALAHRGFSDIPIRDLIVSAPQSRRRAGVKAMRLKDRVILGFTERGTHRLVDLEHCAVLRPEIMALLPKLKVFFQAIMRSKADADITWTDSGLDVDLHGVKLDGIKAQMRAAAFAEDADLARLSIDGETILERRSPIVRFGETAVALPPGAFLQATVDGERSLQQTVLEALSDAGHVADLFCGLGTFTFPIAARATVHAVDYDATMMAALSKAIRGNVKVKAERRDLFRNPLRAAEFKGIDAVVLDPPRAGAMAQVETLVTAGVPRIVMVSCNPASFARDARHLVDAGYGLHWVQPVDQFLWSPHLELVALFLR